MCKTAQLTCLYGKPQRGSRSPKTFLVTAGVMMYHLLCGHVDIPHHLLDCTIGGFKYISFDNSHLAAGSEHVRVSHRRLAVWICGLIKCPAGLEATEDLLCWGKPMFHNTLKQGQMKLQSNAQYSRLRRWRLASLRPVLLSLLISAPVRRRGSKRNSVTCGRTQTGRWL